MKMQRDENMELPKFSIIIPVSKINENLKECVEHCLKLDYPNFETIVLPDSEEKMDFPETKIIPTGSLPPSHKRDIGAKHATGEILAFIDDDAYPRRDWLKNAEKYFEDVEVGGVGGPAVTPSSDNTLQRASGEILSSFMGGGSYTYRYVPKERREVDDYPTCNFLVRKSVMKKLGGFDTKYWPGEDTKLCLDITKKLNKKIIYAPDVLVYHHRKEVFKPHLQQIWKYAVHRGFFAKKFPETSLRISYFLPTFLVLGISLGWLMYFVHYILFYSYLLLAGVYLLAVLSTGLTTKSFKLSILVPIGIILTHLCYGIGFLIGLLKKDLVR